MMVSPTTEPEAEQRPHRRRGGRSDDQEGGLSFPLKLHAMLDDAHSKDFTDVVAWQKGDKSFRVNDVNRFGSEIMPRYFNQTKFKSFQRQLNIYGFRRIQHGPLKGGYVHKSFIRGRPELSTGVTRRRNNATMAQKVIEMVQNASAVGGTQSEVAANLESMMAEADDEPIRNIAASVDFGSCNLQGVLERIFQAEETDELAGVTSPVKISGGHLRSASGFVFNLNEDPNNEADPDMNALFQILAGNGEDAEEEADPGARVPPMAAAPARGGSDSALSDAEQEEQEEQLSERIFPLKLHKMLEHAERDGIQHIVSWVNNGTGFKVHNSKLFTEQVMPMYFDQTKYESFRRQLNLYCFARISRGPQRGVYSHPSFVSGRRELLSNVTRKISAAESKLPASNSHEDMSPSSNQIRSYTGIHSKHASVTV